MRSHKLFVFWGIRHALTTSLLLLAAVLVAAMPAVSVQAQTIYDSSGELGDWTIASGTLSINTDTLTMTWSGDPAQPKTGTPVAGVAVFRFANLFVGPNVISSMSRARCPCRSRRPVT